MKSDRKEYNKEYYLKNKIKINEANKQWRLRNKLILKQKQPEKDKLYRKNNIEKIKVRQKNYYLKNKEKINEQKKKYYNLNKNKFINLAIEYKRNKYKNNINFKLIVCLRARLKLALKNNSKKGKTLNYLGCTIDELKQYLETKFQPGMTWENHSFKGWHMDHIIPLCKFDLTKEEELYRACHYTNLQPLWAKENLSKGNRTT